MNQWPDFTDWMHKSYLQIVVHSLFFFLQVATFILQKILLDETGLSYICQTYERFSHVAMILVSIPVYAIKH